MNTLAHIRQGRELLSRLTVDAGGVRWVDTASQPKVLDDLAAGIAEGVRELGASSVVCWMNVDDAVLAHAVARHLGVPVRRGDENLGLLTLEPDTGDDEAVILLAVSWTMHTPLAALYSLLVNKGVRVLGAVSLLPGSGRPLLLPAEVPFLVLADT
jgi:hypothetical protein